MGLNISRSSSAPAIDVDTIASFIAGIQRQDGQIPWSTGGKTDPWDHVESAMGLSVAGYRVEAERAYGWMAETQLEDGSWWAALKDNVAVDKTKDANFSSYIAVGVFHHYLITGDGPFLKAMWPTVRKGIDYALRLQAPGGEIYWARNGEGMADPMALLTGCSSIFMSIKCALAIASRLGEKMPAWEQALARLGEAIRNKPNLFNMMKARYSMDWYYPVLCGAVTSTEARKRIDKSWDKFVVPDWGVRCVSDRPWVTVAETAELVIALAAIDEYERAKAVFSWICDKRFDDGAFWMGVTFPDRVVWPEEKTAWTAAAVLLAHDALHGLSPAGRLFAHDSWDGHGFREEGPSRVKSVGSCPLPANETLRG